MYDGRSIPSKQVHRRAFRRVQLLAKFTGEGSPRRGDGEIRRRTDASPTVFQSQFVASTPCHFGRPVKSDSYRDCRPRYNRGY